MTLYESLDFAEQVRINKNCCEVFLWTSEQKGTLPEN